jgi:hypothetical protein
VADAKTTTTGSAGPKKNPPSDGGEGWEAPAQRVKTVDADEYNLGWTAQSPSHPEVPEELNPVTYSRDQLPDPAAMVEQGVPIENYLAQFSEAAVDVPTPTAADGPGAESLGAGDDDDDDVENVDARSASKRPAAKKA